MAEACANCGEILQQAYCPACGQKRIVDADRRLGHLLRHAFAMATDLDGRFWGSLRALLFQPGRLSRDYLDGRRRRWMAPFSLFVFANVLYFLLPTALTDFNLPLHSQLAQPHSGVTRPWVEARVADRNADAVARWEATPPDRRAPQPPAYTLQDYARDYDAEAGDVGKALIVVHIPVLALALMAAFWRRRMYFAEHVVVATHQFTFVLLYIQLLVLPAGWLYFALGYGGASGGMPGWVKIATTGLIGLYMALSLRRVYACSWPVALLLPFLLNTMLLVANVAVYRTLQFLVTFALT